MVAGSEQRSVAGTKVFRTNTSVGFKATSGNISAVRRSVNVFAACGFLDDAAVKASLLKNTIPVVLGLNRYIVPTHGSKKETNDLLALFRKTTLETCGLLESLGMKSCDLADLMIENAKSHMQSNPGDLRQAGVAFGIARGIASKIQDSDSLSASYIFYALAVAQLKAGSFKQEAKGDLESAARILKTSAFKAKHDWEANLPKVPGQKPDNDSWEMNKEAIFSVKKELLATAQAYNVKTSAIEDILRGVTRENFL